MILSLTTPTHSRAEDFVAAGAKMTYMEDKETKKQLAKVPDVDKHGEPIWKIERSEELTEKRKRADVPLFLRKNSTTDKGNQMDEKDRTPE